MRISWSGILRVNLIVFVRTLNFKIRWKEIYGWGISVPAICHFMVVMTLKIDHSDVCRGGIVVCFVALGKRKAFCGTDSCKSWKIWLQICRGGHVCYSWHWVTGFKYYNSMLFFFSLVARNTELSIWPGPFCRAESGIFFLRSVYDSGLFTSQQKWHIKLDWFYFNHLLFYPQKVQKDKYEY